MDRFTNSPGEPSQNVRETKDGHRIPSHAAP